MKTIFDCVKLVNEAYEEMKAIGLDPQKVDEIKVESIQKKYRSLASIYIPSIAYQKRPEEKVVLYLDRKLFKEGADPKKIKCLIFHELIHTCRGGIRNHPKEFWDIVSQIEKAYGYEIRRFLTLKDIYRDNSQIVSKRYCPVCGRYAALYEDDNKNVTMLCPEHGLELKEEV